MLYGALVLLVGVGLLLTAMFLLGRAIDSSPLYGGQYGHVTITDQNGRVLFAGDPDQLARMSKAQAQSYLQHAGLVYFAVIVVVGAAGGYLLAKQALRPIAQVTALARQLSTETLDRRIHLGGPTDELRELADTFDEMLARLDAAFESQRLFVANASHELRTPLSVMRTELDVTLADPDASAAELREMGEIVLQGTERAQRLVASLLVLARLQAGGTAELEITESVDLAELVPAVVATVTEEADERRIAITQDLAPAGTIGDPRLLERLIGNLVENAVRHNIDGGWVRITAGTAGERAALSVSNGGPVIAPADLDDLFQPFRRLARVRTATRGSGLGLSIVRLIVAAHHGELQVSAPPGGGLTVRVTLPRTTPAAPDPETPARAVDMVRPG